MGKQMVKFTSKIDTSLKQMVKWILYFHWWCKFFGTYYSIQALLSAPNPDDPLSENIAKHWKSNEVEAVETGMSLLLAWLHQNSFFLMAAFNMLCIFYSLTKMVVFLWMQPKNGPDYMPAVLDDWVDTFGLK